MNTMTNETKKWTYTDAYSFLGGEGVAEDFDIDQFMRATSPDDDVETLNEAAASLRVKTIYGVYAEFEHPVCYGSRVEYQTSSYDEIAYDTEDEAREWYDSDAKGSWEVENACSNGRLKLRGDRRHHCLSKQVWRVDEDGEFIELLKYEVLEEDIYPQED